MGRDQFVLGPSRLLDYLLLPVRVAPIFYMQLNLIRNILVECAIFSSSPFEVAKTDLRPLEQLRQGDGVLYSFEAKP